jgi:hypothetical protein
LDGKVPNLIFYSVSGVLQVDVVLLPESNRKNVHAVKV